MFPGAEMRLSPCDQGPAQFSELPLQVSQSHHVALPFCLMHLLLQAFELSFDVAPSDGREAIVDLLLHPSSSPSGSRTNRATRSRCCSSGRRSSKMPPRSHRYLMPAIQGLENGPKIRFLYLSAAIAHVHRESNTMEQQQLYEQTFRPKAWKIVRLGLGQTGAPFLSL